MRPLTLLIAAATCFFMPLPAEEGAVIEELEMEGDVDPECYPEPHHHSHCHSCFYYWGPEEDPAAQELDYDTSWAGEREDSFYDSLTR